MLLVSLRWLRHNSMYESLPPFNTHPCLAAPLPSPLPPSLHCPLPSPLPLLLPCRVSIWSDNYLLFLIIALGPLRPFVAAATAQQQQRRRVAVLINCGIS